MNLEKRSSFQRHHVSQDFDDLGELFSFGLVANAVEVTGEPFFVGLVVKAFVHAAVSHDDKCQGHESQLLFGVVIANAEGHQFFAKS